MASLQAIRDAIAAKISGVAGAGLVHSYERFTKRPDDFAAFFVTGGTVNGWIIRRIATRETSPGLGRYVITHRWQLRYYRALDDAGQSEHAFDTTIEEVRDAFRNDENLGAVVDNIVVDGEAGLQLEDSGPVFLGGVLCHGARLKLSTRHFQ